MSSLKQLLLKVDKLFPSKRHRGPDFYSFELSRVKRGYWEFSVVDDWHKWMDKNLETNFGLYPNPEDAIKAFLKYVKENKINVSKLC